MRSPAAAALRDLNRTVTGEADRLGIHPATLSEWLSGRHRPDPAKLALLPKGVIALIPQIPPPPSRRRLGIVETDYIVSDEGFETPCWLWRGLIIPSGYGGLKVGGKNVLAHRYAYECAYGPIPAGTDLHHRCEIRRCIRLDHLEPCRRGDHARRHTRIGDETRRLIEAEPGTLRAVAAKYGISATHVSRIKRMGHSPPSPH